MSTKLAIFFLFLMLVSYSVENCTECSTNADCYNSTLCSTPLPNKKMSNYYLYIWHIFFER